MLLIFLDTETTGLNPEKHRTLEIALKGVDLETGQVVVSYESIVRQTAEVWEEADQESLRINGFTWEKTLAGKPEKVVGTEIANDLNHAKLKEKGGVFICQNPSFDRSFFNQLISVDMQNEFHWPYHWLDLASMYWAFCHMREKKSAKELSERSLSKNHIAAAFGLPKEPTPHRAMNGVSHLMACYEAVIGATLKI